MENPTAEEKHKMKRTIFYLAILAILFPAAVALADKHLLFISPEYAAAQMKKSSGLLLVDVRTKDEFEQINIPGSINVPLHFVKTKTYLKNKTIVLVNQGFSTRQLIRECSSLKKAGFDARILNGGITAWIQNGLDVDGDPFVQQSISQVSPRDVHHEQPAGSFLPVNISKEENNSPFADTVHLKYPGKDFLSILININKSHPTGSILIFNQTGIGYEAASKQILPEGIERVYFLQGGMHSYKSYLANRESSMAPRNLRVESTDNIKCRSCQEE